MLTVEIKHFRTWENLTLNIPLTGITLLKGVSGAGKSTILKAISWCMHGKIRKITPHTNEKAKTYVSLSFGSHKIERYRDPNRLIYNHNGRIEEDKAAQLLINETFGNAEVWNASCYVVQKRLNSFITTSNIGKMELLNAIAFREDDPSVDHKLITDRIVILEKEYLELYKNYESDLKLLEAMLPNYKKELVIKDTTEYENRLLEITKELEVLMPLIQQRNVQLQLIATYSKYKEPIKPTFTIRYNTDQPEVISQYIASLMHRDKLNSARSKVTNETFPETLDSDLAIAIAAEKEYNLNKSKCNELGVEYPDGIESTIEYYTNLLEMQDYFKLCGEYYSLDDEITALCNKTFDIKPLGKLQQVTESDWSKYSTSSLNNEYNQLLIQESKLKQELVEFQAASDILACPHCSGNVKYHNKELHISTKSPVSEQQILDAKKSLLAMGNQLKDIKKSITQLEQDEKSMRQLYTKQLQENQKKEQINATISINNEKNLLLKEQRDIAVNEKKQLLATLNSKIQEFNVDSNIQPEIIEDTQAAYKFIAQLQALTVVELPSIRSSVLSAMIERRKKHETAIRAEKEYIEYLESIPFNDVKVTDMQRYLKDLTTFNHDLISYQQKCALLEEQNALLAKVRDELIPDPQPAIDLLKQEQLEIQAALTNNLKMQEIIAFHSKVSQLEDDVNALNADLSAQKVLKEKAIHTETSRLEGIVKHINATIIPVCKTIFDEPIRINLALSKTLKTTGITKSQINFEIYFKDGVFDSIEELSGGEEDRGSLALTLALKKMSRFPLLMLDESFSGIGSDMKEFASRSVKEHATASLLVMHEGIEGIFDHIIDIDEMVPNKLSDREYIEAK